MLRLIGRLVDVANGLPCTLLVVIDGLSTRQPGIFGERGGYSRFFSLTSMLFPLGTLLGPLLSGTLAVKFGYLVMNLVMGMYEIASNPLR